MSDVGPARENAARDDVERAPRRGRLAWLGRVPLALPAIGLAAGLLAPRLLFATRAQALVGVACALAVAVIALRADRRWWAMVAVLGVAFAIGARAALPLRLPPQPGTIADLAARWPGPASVTGVVVDLPTATPGRVGLTLEVSSARVRGTDREVTGRVRVSVYGLPESGVCVPPWRSGDRLALIGTLRRPRDLATPGIASYREWLEGRGIRALLQVKTPQLVSVDRRPPTGLIVAVREHVIEVIDHYLAGRRRVVEGSPCELIEPTRTAAILKAMLVQDRSHLEPDERRLLAEAGLLHVLAISGLHVGMLGAAVYGLVLLVSRRREELAIALSIVAVWSYVLVAGAPPPAVRAAIVTTVVAAGRLMYRDAPAVNSLLLAFLIGATIEPGGVRDAGFQMTFAASFGLLHLTPMIAGRRRPRFLWLALGASIGAQIAVLPVAVAHFGRVPLAGVVLNLVAVPLAAATLLGGVLLVIAAPLNSGLATLVATFDTILVDLLFAVAEPRAIPWSYRLQLQPGWLAALVFATLVWACAGSAPHRRRVVVTLVGFVLLLVPRRPVATDGLRVTAIDVGQGDAFLVEVAGGGTLLMDAGGSPRSGFDVGDRIVVPFLLARGHRKLDVVVVSHAHPDHAEGVSAVLRELDVGELWLGADPPADPLIAELRAAAASATRTVEARRGHVKAWPEGAVARVLHPSTDAAPTTVDNSSSLVVEVRTATSSVLLTGDIYVDAEHELIGVDEIRATTVLKVAHHGSRTSSSERFLTATQPRMALISCGYESRFGHPHAEVLERLRALQIRWRRTDLDGTVTIETTASGHTRLNTERARFGRLR